MASPRKSTRFFEPLLIHSMAALAAMACLVICGNDYLGGRIGLLHQLRPFFTAPFALLVGISLISILILNRRWKSIVVILLGEAIHVLLLVGPFRSRPFLWDEYTVASVSIASLLVSACLCFGLVDE